MFKYLVFLKKWKEELSKPLRYARSKLSLLHLYLKGELNEEGEGSSSAENKYVEFLYWFGEILGYGFLINIPLWGLLQWKLNPLTIMSYGILWWLIAKYRGKI